MNKMPSFRNHPNKDILREKWCKPIIQTIYNTLNYKFLYLGLPGINALDISTWIDYIEEVIAFEYSDEENEDEFNKLNEYLNKLERERKINAYRLYCGWMEEIIISGQDDNNIPFIQNDVVTIYNLDFCNTISSPIKIYDDKTQTIQKYYKFESIRRLLEIQRSILDCKKQKKFVMFLTVHEGLLETEIKNLQQHLDQNLLDTYLKNINGLNNTEKGIRLLKLYIYSILNKHFSSCSFSPEFLPTIFYEGTGGHKLLLFTILGTYEQNPSGFAKCYQDIQECIMHKFLSPKKGIIDILNLAEIKEINIPTDPCLLIKDSYTLKELW